ncbi:unnamed protein product, partial [Brassica oleracea var. botrytis]
STVLELSLHLEPSLHLKLSLHLSPSLSVSLNLHHELSDTNPSQALSLDLQCISLSLLQTQTHLEFSLFELHEAIIRQDSAENEGAITRKVSC